MKTPSCGVIAFGVGKAVVVVNAGQQRRACLDTILPGKAQAHQRRLKLRTIGFCAGEGIGQG